MTKTGERQGPYEKKEGIRFTKPFIAQVLSDEAETGKFPERLTRVIRQLSAEIDSSLSGKPYLDEKEVGAIFNRIEEAVITRDDGFGKSLRKRGIYIKDVLNAREKMLGG